MGTSLAHLVRDELLILFEPLLSAASPEGFAAMLASFGHTEAVAGQTSLSSALQQVAEVVGELGQMDDEALGSWQGLTQLLKIANDTFTAVHDVDTAVHDPTLLTQVKDLGEEIANRLVTLYLRARLPGLYRTASLLTLVTPAEMLRSTPLQLLEGQIVRMPWVDDQLHLDRVSPLMNHPWATLSEVYFPNGLAQTIDAYNSADRLLPVLRLLATTLGLPCASDLFSLSQLPDEDDDPAPLDHFSGDPDDDSSPAADGDLEAMRLLRMPRLVTLLPGLDGSERLGIAMTVSSREHAGGVAGLIVSLESGGKWSETHGAWKLDFAADGQVPAFVIGPGGVSLPPITGPMAGATGSFAVTHIATGGPAFLFGSANGTRVEIGDIEVGVQFALSPTSQSIGLSAGVDRAVLAIVPGDGDSFLSSVLPSGGLRINFDLALLASSDKGLSLRGGAGLDATIPVGLSLGPLSIPSIHLGLLAGISGISFETSATVGLAIGPVQAILDRLGLFTKVEFPANGGNLGPADFSLRFKPPTGVGLAIDSAGVTGGGELSHDDAKHEYSGVLQLTFNEIALQAYGLITTQVAGRSGYSLLALVDANFPPVQLGWGFTLNGVGGLLAVHRTADTDALRAALKADKLSTILFPKTAITNAPLVLSQLDALFPTAQGRFLFGPMALIGWGNPTVLTIALAVILELPEPIRIVLLARLAARLPSQTNPLVRINMDALGVLDLSQGQLSLDATLFDSKIMGFSLTGDMALRANWSTQREFLLAIGGFHPRFTPPAGFPALQRITIDMPSGSITKLRLAAYLAITSNTVQFGATLDVFIGVGGFGLAGHLGFDALLQIDPFHFDADISGSIALKAGGDDLMSVELDATISGPAPWNIAGKFKIHIIFFDVHKSFSYTWGDSTSGQQLPAVHILPLLVTAMADSRNWGTQLAANVPALVSLRLQDGPTVAAHPLAQLEVHESLVPLGLQITRFGAAAISGDTTFTITDLQVSGATVFKQTAAVQDDFAPAQFFDLSDEEKLAGPSFERHDAGLRWNAGLATCGASVSKTISYETFYVDQPGVLRTDTPAPQGFLFTANLLEVMNIGASGRAPVRRAGKLRFQAPGNPVMVKPPSFTVAGTSTMSPAGLTTGATYSDAKALMSVATATSPGLKTQLQIVGIHEMAVA